MNRRVQYWPFTGAYIVYEDGKIISVRLQNGTIVEGRDYSWAWRAAA